MILAVDPGGTTGWVTWARNDLQMWGQARDPLVFLDDVLRWKPEVLIVERYTITAQTIRKSRQPEALELIGALRWLAHRVGAEFVLQSPASAKRFATDGKLERVGPSWYSPGLPHANDAKRHLLLYLVTHRLIDVRGLVRGDG